MSEAPGRVVYEFGDFLLDPIAHALYSRADGASVTATPRVIDTLLYLIEHRGELLEKSTLLAQIWPNVLVEENSLNQHVSAIRRVLGEKPGGARYIVTVPGRGYRFISEVFTRVPGNSPPDPDVAPPPPASIAVLPFASLGDDPKQEHFGDAMAEELIHLLSRVRGLKVPARTSSFAYKGRNLHVKQIARDLHVATLLEGSVRGTGSRVRVSVQLVDANSGYHMWSQTFDRASHDIFVLQDELAHSIVDALATHLGIELPALEHRSPPTLNVSAYQCYLQARALQTRSNEQSLRSAVALHREAIGQDPAFARAYSGAASANLALAGMAFSFDQTLSEAEHDSRRALTLDPGLAEAHAVLGALFCFRAQLLDAETCLRTARFLDPTDAHVLTMHAILVTAAVGHMQKTQRELSAAYEMAPAHPGALIALAFLGLQFGRNSEALRFVELAEGLGFASNALPLPFIRSQVAWRAGDYGQAALYASAIFAREPDSGLIRKLIESVLQGTADSAQAQAASRDLRRLALDPTTRILDPIRYPRPLLLWATLLGDLDLAYAIAGCVLEEFERSGVLKVAAGFCNQFWQPEMRPFRHDSRFQTLARQLGLAEFWEVHGAADPE